jgi:hypothetical protein
VLSGEHRPVAATDFGASDDCCLGQNCNECCAHTAAMAPQWRVAAAVPAVASPLPSLSMDFEPTADPVAFRPPIAI